MTNFHVSYYRLLDAFARGSVRRLMISVPPQHGKSLGASRLLPAYILGLNPDLRIAIGSYSFALARKFGMGVRQLLECKRYEELFPATYLKGSRGSSRGENALLTADEFDCVGRLGGMRMVGRECSLTGNRVDVMILDDLYKDAMEANSSVIRENTWDWYTSVVRTRMHNDSREIIVFTRWHEDDLIGRLSRSESVVDLSSFDQLNGLSPQTWVRVNFEALKTTPPTEVDPRSLGEALWPERIGVELLKERKKLDPKVFDALYQGNPSSREGLLYSEFQTYQTLPQDIVRYSNYTDTADTGGDYLCSITYALTRADMLYVTDVVYTDAPMEETEQRVARMLGSANVHSALVESNNGGRGFARTLERLTRAVGARVEIKTFHQTASKEARILSNASEVMRRVVMPENWRERWPAFAQDIKAFKRQFKANPHDDAPDAITGIVETETNNSTKKIKSVTFTNYLKK